MSNERILMLAAASFIAGLVYEWVIRKAVMA